MIPPLHLNMKNTLIDFIDVSMDNCGFFERDDFVWTNDLIPHLHLNVKNTS